MQDPVWEEIVLRLERGEPWAELAHELEQTPSGLNEDERAALWLSAWSSRPGGKTATDHLLAQVQR